MVPYHARLVLVNVDAFWCVEVTIWHTLLDSDQQERRYPVLILWEGVRHCPFGLEQCHLHVGMSGVSAWSLVMMVIEGYLVGEFAVYDGDGWDADCGKMVWCKMVHSSHMFVG